MRKREKFLLSLIFTLTLMGTSLSNAAEKWQSFIFSDDLEAGFYELDKYCMLNNVTVENVFWANKISSADVKPGTSIYLPKNHADMLAIWQNKGAWESKALVPIMSAAAAKRAIEGKTQTPQINSEETKTTENVISQTTRQPEEKKIETPKEVIADLSARTEIAKPDKILTSSKPKKEIEGLSDPDRLGGVADPSALADPIIVLSPNGDPNTGPMRLIISGDKVEVVELPKNAAPKRPSLSDLDYAFGTNPNYLMPYYNLTPRPQNNLPINRPGLNFGNLGGKMLWPVEGKVSSYFGMRGKRKHEGIDIPMPSGTPIRAARNGIVAQTGNNTPGFRGYGNFVLLDHGGGLQTFYAHCLKVAVVPGQRIMQGQVLGYVGRTGRSTGDHLHFEVRVNNVKVDPIPYLSGNTHLASNK